MAVVPLATGAVTAFATNGARRRGRAVLRLVRPRERFHDHQAAAMHRWPPSGFHMQTAVWMPEGDGALATRFVRTCARNPVALERLTDDRATKAVTCRYKSDGPTAGPETVDPLAFVARVVVYGPDTGQVTTRHGAGHDPNDGWHANRVRSRVVVAKSGIPACNSVNLTLDVRFPI